MTIAPSVLAPFVDDIAFAADTEPATTPTEFIDQLGTAAINLGHFARINGAEDLETAATYLTDAMETKGGTRKKLLAQAVKYLVNTADMVDEYRLMV